MSPASSLSQATSDEVEAPPSSEPSHPSNPWHRPPPMREALATIDEEAFDFHDTIPAPPWLDEADSNEEPPTHPR